MIKFDKTTLYVTIAVKPRSNDTDTRASLF